MLKTVSEPFARACVTSVLDAAQLPIEEPGPPTYRATVDEIIALRPGGATIVRSQGYPARLIADVARHVAYDLLVTRKNARNWIVERTA